MTPNPTDLERLLELSRKYNGSWEDWNTTDKEEYNQLKDKITKALENNISICPICNGNGLVPNGFYAQTSGRWSTSSTSAEQCQSCNGCGYIPQNQHTDECRKASKELETQIEVNTRLSETLVANQNDHLQKETLLLEQNQQAPAKLKKIEEFHSLWRNGFIKDSDAYFKLQSILKDDTK